MIHPGDLRELVIRPTLKHIGLWSQAAENLLMGTWFYESTIGSLTHLKQVKGPAISGYQIEPATHQDQYKTYLNARSHWGLRAAVLSLASSNSVDELSRVNDSELIGNIPYATAIARIKYYRDPEPLPSAGDPLALGRYWKRVYNTSQGAGNAAEWANRYDEYCNE